MPYRGIAVPNDEKVGHEAGEGQRRKRSKQCIGHIGSDATGIAIPDEIEDAKPGAHRDLLNYRPVKWHKINAVSKQREIN